MRTTLRTSLCLGLLCLLASTAEATLLGDEVFGTLNRDGDGNVNLFSDTGTTSPVAASVGGGIEFTSLGVPPGGAGLTADVADSSVSVSIGVPFPISMPIPLGVEYRVWLEGLQWVGTPSAVIDAVVLTNGPQDGTVVTSWTDDSIHLTFTDQFLVTNQGPPLLFAIQKVPEPSAGWLIASGLLVAGARRRES